MPSPSDATPSATSASGGFRLNPVTLLTFAAVSVVLVLVANRWFVSLAAWLLAGALVACGGPRPGRAPGATGAGAAARRVARARRRKVFASATALSLPAFVGFSLMYAPFGEVPGWWIITRDGLWVAVGLGLRFLGASTTGLAIGSFIDFDELMRALQPRVPAKLLYVVGATFRLFPMAKARLEMIRQVQVSRGLGQRSWRARWAMVLPLIVGLVDDAAQRARPLQRTGIGAPGPRTVLRPVPDRPVDKALRVAAVLLLCAGVWAANL